DKIEKKYLAYDKKSKNEYLSLINQLDDEIIGVCSEIILLAERNMGKLSHRLHIVLTDHIGFAIERLKNGLEIQNPFTLEIKNLYHKEFEVGLIAQDMIKKQLGIEINEDEVGFIALHLNAAKQNKDVKESLKNTRIIKMLVGAIEESLGYKIGNDLTYNRLINHLKGSIERVQRGIAVDNPLLEVVKNEFKKSYEIALRIKKIVSDELEIELSDGELGYLAIHIDRINRIFNK
ncbi:MAG: PRD domain-containing protein, partial [Clostridiales bacterium]|nr:PRD domain-containing protein [Clostridiales bacterium]